MNIAAFTPFAITVIVLFLLVMPLLGVLEFNLLERSLSKGRRDARLWFYGWSIGVQWLLTVALLVWWFSLDRDLYFLGMVPVVTEWQWLAVVGGLLLSFLLFPQMNMVLGSDEHLKKVRGSLGKLELMAPRESVEQQFFQVLSVTAGVCEEILYRGMLMFVLTAAFGQWPALILASAIFGLGHFYQGLTGVGKSATAGLVLGLLAIFSGSILVGMVLHTVLDLTGGRVLQATVNLPGKESAGDGTEIDSD